MANHGYPSSALSEMIGIVRLEPYYPVPTGLVTPKAALLKSQTSPARHHQPGIPECGNGSGIVMTREH
jgi:hypothetical protein